MAGYLGKISAVVSVNTGDFASKLSQCAKNVSAFANSTEQSLANSARASQRSFGSIYSDVQKLERQLRAAAALNLSGIAKIDSSSLAEAANKMRAIHSVASQLSEPLSKSVAAISAMSMEMRRVLHPAMTRAQELVQGVQTAATTTGRVTKAEFAAASAAVDAFARKAEYAKEVVSSASRMTGAQGFRFQNAGLYDEFQRGSQLNARVSALPATQITPELVRLIDLQKKAADQAARLAASVSAAPNALNVTGLKGASAALESINDSILRVLNSYDEVERIAESNRKAIEDAEKAKEQAAKRAAEEQERATAKLLALSQDRGRATTGEVQSISQLESAYASLLARLSRVSEARRKASGGAIGTPAAEIEAAISSNDANALPGARSAMSSVEATVSLLEAADRDDREAAKRREDSAKTLAGLQARRAQAATSEAQTVSQLGSQYDALVARVSRLPAAYRAAAAAALAANASMVEFVISEGTDSDVASVRAEVAAIEAVVKKNEDLAAADERARKSTDDLRASLARIADSIGQPAAPIDRAAKAVARMNAEIEKIDDKALKAAAQTRARAIKSDLLTESQLSSGPRDVEIDAIAARATGLGNAAAKVNAQGKAKPAKTADDIFGPAVGSRANQIDQLKSKIVATQSEMQKLPLPLQVAMRPELEKIRALFLNLGPSSTRKEIEDATRQAKLFGDEVGRQVQADKFSGSFGVFLDDSAAKKYEAELAAIQRQMAAVGATASGSVATAINRYRAALETSSRAGTLGTEAVRDQMQNLVVDIEKAVVAEGKLTESQAKAVFGGIRREGDVGRGGADKAGLALNQLAFAVDDFMSASGGVEMKIRAISNNLTQMAFIIGQTRGLWIALGAVIASQAAIALYKFFTGGKTADDTAKALSDTLSKQKSIVTELASAYSQLSKATALSSNAQRGLDAASSRGAVASANAAARRTRLTGVDAASVNEAASQAAIQRMMEATTEVGVLVYRNERMRESRARQSVAEAAARRTPAGRAEELDGMRSRRAAIVRTIENNLGGRTLESLGFTPTWNRQVNALSKELESLEARIRATENVFADLADRASLAAIDASQVAKLRIEAAGSLLADAIASGVPGAAELQNNLDALSIQMSAALSRLSDAAAIEDQKIRAREVVSAQADINAASAKTTDLIASSVAMTIRAAFARPGAGEMLGQIGDSPRFSVGRVRAVAAAADLAGAQSQLGVRNAEVAASVAEANRVRSEGRKNVVNAELAANTAAEQKELAERNLEADDARLQAARDAWMAAEMELEAQKKAAAESERAAQANVAAAEAARNKAQADVEAAQAASKAAAAFLEASIGIEAALERTRKIGAGGLSSAEQRADLAQRRFTERPSDDNRARRDEAEQDLRRARKEEAVLQANLDRAMRRAQDSPAVSAASEIIRNNEDVIAEIQARAAAAGGDLGGNDRDAIRRAQIGIAAAERARADAVSDSTAAERAAMDAFARKERDRLEVAEAEARAPQARAEERARVRQGREDAMSKRSRGVLEAARSAENMAAAAGEFANPAARRAFVQDYFNEQRKQVLEGGPLKQAQDERLNSILGGPSRQSLESSDVTSMDGQRELSRLLRGDDASRDVNFAEMKHQSDLLQQIAEGIKAATGITVDF